MKACLVPVLVFTISGACTAVEDAAKPDPKAIAKALVDYSRERAAILKNIEEDPGMLYPTRLKAKRRRTAALHISLVTP